MRRAQPVRRGHAAGAAGEALPRHDSRRVAQEGVRLRRGREGGGLHDADQEDLDPDPAAAAVQEPRQRGHLGVRAGPLPAADRRGQRRLHPDRDGGVAADRRGRPGQGRAHRRQGPRQGRRAQGQLRARHRHQGQGDRPGRGLLGPPDRARHPRVRPRRGPRAPDLGARRQGGLEGPEGAGPRDPHDRPVAGGHLGQVRPGRRHVDLSDEGRGDRRGPGVDRLRDRPRVRRRHHLGPRPAADVQAASAGQEDPGGRRARELGRQGAARRRLLVDAQADRCPARCWSATPAAWSTPCR